MLLAGAGLAVALGLAELATRLWLGPAVSSWMSVGASGPPAGLYLQSAQTGVRMAAGFSGVTDAGVPIHTDALGNRSPPPAGGDPTRSAPGWLVLGDSFAAAIQVPAEDTFAERLAAMRGQPVHNAGVDGFSTYDALARAEALVGQLPLVGLVLVYYTGNDLEENARWERTRGRLPQVVDGAAFPLGPDPHGPLRWLLGASVLGHVVVGTLQARTEPVPGPDSTPAQQLWPFHSRGAATLQAWTGPTGRALARFAALARRRGLPLVVAIAPPAYAVTPGLAGPTFARYGLDPAGARLGAPGAAVAGLAQDAGLPICDLGPALADAENAGQGPYLRFEGHWSETGHAAVASALAACLDQVAPL